MKAMIFAKRCLKETLRDPLTYGFGVGFPVILLILLSVMNKFIPAEAQMDLFHVERLLPGVIVFGFSFLALFGGLLVSTDRDTAFLTRLFTSPLRASDFILGYALPLFPMALLQTVLCVVVALPFGLSPTPRLMLMLVFLIPSALLFIGFGLLFGSLLSAKQVGGFCGALLTNVSAWLSGTYFSLDLLGKGFHTFAHCLPFANAVDLARMGLSGDLAGVWKPLLIVCAYAAVIFVLAVVAFLRKMRV